MTVDVPAGGPLSGMRGRLATVPRPPHVILPAPVPDGNDSQADVEMPIDDPQVSTEASAGRSANNSLPGAASAGATSRATAKGLSLQDMAPASGKKARPVEQDGPAVVQELLELAQSKGFRRVVRDLYDDLGWDDGINMTWALPRAVRDTVARFGLESGLANKRAATAVMYIGLMQLGLEVRESTEIEDRSNRRRS